ncbi:MAG: tRNA epoxyqueuosine(34) reductase QueG [Planctomycetes bacterium RBG_13_62_9]|nr:MAG: tRNA epoxyqueuosine(34) reductase QueG [Planctomycetes bacterium RBG_13_62_9]
MTLEQEIKDKALALGFNAVGITDASPIGPEHVEHFEAWLQAGYAGRMHYMHRNLQKRVHPAKLLEGAKSVIVVALNYKPPAMATAVGWAPPIVSPSVGRVAIYAQYEDYHSFIKSLLRELAEFIRMKTDKTQQFKICVDSAPLAEKALAVRAGLGFIGKNHLLIHSQLGPQILLGAIITTVGLCPDGPVDGSCGGCDRCLRACPTGVLRPDGYLEASRCISYLTQYETQDLSEGQVGNWLFGCDECLLACPFQQTAPVCTNQHFEWHPERDELDLREVLELTAEEFEAKFHDSPVGKLGLDLLKSNARRCLKL